MGQRGSIFISLLLNMKIIDVHLKYSLIRKFVATATLPIVTF